MQWIEYEKWLNFHRIKFRNVDRFINENKFVIERWHTTVTSFKFTVEELNAATEQLKANEPKGLFPEQHMQALIDLIQEDRKNKPQQRRRTWLDRIKQWEREHQPMTPEEVKEFRQAVRKAMEK